jgi:hypothetical protein
MYYQYDHLWAIFPIRSTYMYNMLYHTEVLTYISYLCENNIVRKNVSCVGRRTVVCDFINVFLLLFMVVWVPIFVTLCKRAVLMFEYFHI